MKALFDYTKKISIKSTNIKINFFIFIFNLIIFNNSFAQWTNGQSAVRVVGPSDFTSLGSFYASGIAVDVTNQKLYISDMCDNTVKRYPLTTGSLASTPSAEATFGTSSTSGTSSTLLKSPSGLGVDNTGRLFIVDGGNHRVVYINSANSASSGATFSGVLGQANFTSGSANRGGSAANNTFKFTISTPSSIFSCTPTVYAAGYIAVTSNNEIFVSDPGNNRVLRFDAPTTTTTAAAVIGQTSMSGTSSGTTQSTLYTPMGIAVNGTTLYITDMNNNRVVRYNAATTITTGTNNASGVYGATSWTSAGTGGTTATQFNLPIGLAVDGTGRLYVNDSNNGRTIFINSASTKDGSGGTAVTFNGVLGQNTLTTATNVASASASAYWAGVTGIAVNSKNNKLYVGNSGYGRALQFNASSALPASFLNIYSKSENNIDKFKFSVVSENNVSKYVIETSNDGIHFQEVGSINANSDLSFPKQYSTEITTNNEAYFRIKAIDQDETITLSAINKINDIEENNWTFYPNPCASTIHFDKITFNESSSIKVNITDLNGKVLIDNTYTTSNFDLNLEELSNGNYIVTIIENDNISHHKINIEK